MIHIVTIFMVTMQLGSKFPKITNKVRKKMCGACVSFKKFIMGFWEPQPFWHLPLYNVWQPLCIGRDCSLYLTYYILFQHDFCKYLSRLDPFYKLINSQLNATQLISTEWKVIMIIGISTPTTPPTHYFFLNFDFTNPWGKKLT